MDAVKSRRHVIYEVEQLLAGLVNQVARSTLFGPADGDRAISELAREIVELVINTAPETDS